METIFNSMPWWSLLIIIISAMILIAYIVHKKVIIRFGKLSIESEKKIIQENEDNLVRLKIHAQIREYENYTGKIERNIYMGFEKTFNDISSEEKVIIKLFCLLVRRALEKQIMLDLIANHIASKSNEELREYTSNKTQGYHNRILNLLSQYNDTVLPRHNILEIVHNIDIRELEDIYYAIYTKSVIIAKQG